MVSRWRVFAGFIAAFLFVLMSHVTSWPRFTFGVLIAVGGLAVRGWAAGYLEKGKRLAQDGPYAWVRHPLYTGSFLMALGFVIAGTSSRYPIHSYLLWALFLALFAGIYPARIKEEELSLEKYFGDAWRAFTKSNHRFLPRLSPNKRPNPDRFDWARYKKNREYQASVGWLVGVLLLVTKGVLRW